MACALEPDFESCFTTCFTADTGLSEECAYCFTLAVNCTMANCSEECMTDPGGEECLACQDEYCGDALEECTGLVEPDTDTATDTSTS